ncbi:hypothetical protein [Nodularia sp. NIES-3585]|nr:hypothetical protein [Nodularia sp. NIES-3585]
MASQTVAQLLSLDFISGCFEPIIINQKGEIVLRQNNRVIK